MVHFICALNAGLPPPSQTCAKVSLPQEIAYNHFVSFSFFLQILTILSNCFWLCMLKYIWQMSFFKETGTQTVHYYHHYLPKPHHERQRHMVDFWAKWSYPCGTAGSFPCNPWQPVLLAHKRCFVSRRLFRRDETSLVQVLHAVEYLTPCIIHTRLGSFFARSPVSTVHASDASHKSSGCWLPKKTSYLDVAPCFLVR